jgi:hypothetical protein
MWWLGTTEGQQALFDEQASVRARLELSNPIVDAFKASGTKMIYGSDDNYKERSRIAVAVRKFALGQ